MTEQSNLGLHGWQDDGTKHWRGMGGRMTEQSNGGVWVAG